MKAIILAAGMGTRLGKYTKDLPKGMLKFVGKTLIERQIETLKESGIDDIVIIRGYNKEKINYEGVKYYENPDYDKTNMVASLMKARDEMNDDVLVCYSDIVYESRLAKQMIKSPYEISVMCDDSYFDYWKARLDNWKDDIESFVFDGNDNLFELGDTGCSLDKANSRYVGMIKFNQRGLEKLVEAYDENEKLFWDSTERWKRSKTFRQAYMTCMLQELIDRGVEVKAIHANHGWMEFDTVEDYEKAMDWVRTGEIKKYINLN